MNSKLIGHTIKGHSDLGQDTLIFETDSVPVKWDVDPDCCSLGKFTDIVGNISSLGPITAVETLASTDERINPAKLSIQPSYDEVECIYGILLTDASGKEVTIVHRNWSNGYYGNGFIETENT
jgi:hypothetical protein